MPEQPNQTTLVSHGWKKRCGICERHTHAKWHEFARGELNPIALIERIERDAERAPEVCKALIDYVVICTGLDVPAVEVERDKERMDPQIPGRSAYE